MNKSLSALLCALSLTMVLSGCSSNSNEQKADSVENNSTSGKNSESSNSSTSSISEQSSVIDFTDKTTIESVKLASKAAFDSYYNSKLTKLDQKEKELAYVAYAISCKKIETLTSEAKSVDEAITLANNYYAKMQQIIGALSFAKDDYNAYYENATNVMANMLTLVSSVTNTYNVEWMEYVFAEQLKLLQDKTRVNSVDAVENILSTLSSSVKSYIEAELSETLIGIITTAKASITTLKDVAIAKIKDNEVVEQLEAAYDKAIYLVTSIVNENGAQAVIQAVIDEYKDTILSYGEDLLASTIEEYRTIALAKLDEIVPPLIEKIPVASLKQKLQEFYDAEKMMINGVNTEELAKNLLAKVKSDAAEKGKEVLATYKTEIITILNGMVTPVLSKIEDNTLKSELQNFYNEQVEKIQALEEVAKAPEQEKNIKEALQAKITDIVAKALVSIKTKGIEAINKIVTENISKIPDETLKKELQDYCDEEISKISAIKDLETAKETIEEIKDDTTTFATELVTNALVALKNRGLKELDDLVNPLLAKIEDQTIKTSITNFYNEEKGKIEAINNVDTASASLKDIKDDTIDFVNSIKADFIISIKNEALDELETLVNAGLAKIEDQAIKTELTNYYNQEIVKVEGISDFETAKTVSAEIINDTKEFIKTELVKALGAMKQVALTELDGVVNPLLENIDDATIKTEIQTFYNNTKKSINDIDSIDTAKASLQQIKTDATATVATLKTKVINSIKSKAIEELDDVVDAALAKISDATLKAELNDYYDTEIAKIAAINDVETAKATTNEVIDDTEDFVKDLLVRALVAMKNKGIEELDGIIKPLIQKVTDESIKTDLTNYYNQEKALIEAVNSIDDIDTTVAQVKKDTSDYVATLKTQIIASIKQTAKNELNLLVNEGLGRLPDGELKTRLNTFKSEQIEKIDAINDVDSASTVADEVIEDTKLFVKELVSDSLKAIKNSMKSALTGANALNSKAPTTYVPSSMLPSYAANLVSEAAITYDFTSFTNISDINYGGFGEQWNMVIEGLTKADSVYAVVSKSETVLTAAANAVNAYLDSKYADEVEHTITDDQGRFVATFNYEDGIFTYSVTLNAGVNIPGFGTIVPTINVEYSNSTSTKVTKIAINENNLVKCVQTNNNLELAVKFGTADYYTTSYINITSDESGKTGNINQFVTAKGKDLVKSSADFYINDTYVTAVGNKADGLTGFKGYINELYKVNEGKLLGYEIQETLTIAGISGTYNTLWFNLNDISGINNIKITDKTKANKSGSSTVDVYLNDSTSLFVPTYNKIAIKTTSRKYDIEYRTRYFYSYDATSQDYVKHEVQIPMMFIQEGDNYSSYSADMLSANSITSSVTMNSTVLQKILDDYDTLIPVFIENKDTVTSETVSTFLAE